MLDPISIPLFSIDFHTLNIEIVLVVMLISENQGEPSRYTGCVTTGYRPSICQISQELSAPESELPGTPNGAFLKLLLNELMVENFSKGIARLTTDDPKREIDLHSSTVY
jgi:hypothetical protein